MTPTSLNTVLRHLRVAAAPAGAVPDDAELLERFVRHRDPAAFELLVWRHQRLVLGVCRRVLGNTHDAEDAFQATFLALVRKAGAISAAQALGSWLYQVAYRTAWRARADAHRRNLREQAAARPDRIADAAGPDADLGSVLDAEVQRLPAKFRAAVVLCYLDGKTYEEAARVLGCPKGTLSTRLTRARALLRARLASRGLNLSAAALAGLAEQTASAAAPAALVARTVQTLGPTGAVPARIAALTKGVLRAMFWTKMQPVLGAALLLTVLALVAAVLPGAGRTAPQQADPPAAASPDGDPPEAQPQRWEPRAVIQLPDVASAIAVSADGKLLAVAIDDYAICVWDLATRKELARLPAPLSTIHALTFSSDGTLVLAAGAAAKQRTIHAGAAMLWNVSTRKIISEIEHAGPPFVAAQFGPGGDSLTLVQAGGTVRQMDLSGKESRVIDVAGLGKGPTVIGDPDHLAAVDGPGGAVALVYLRNGPAYRRFDGPGDSVAALAFSSDLKLLAAAYARRDEPVRVRIFETATAKQLAEIAPPKLAVHCLSFSPGGKRLAAACGDGTVKVWDTASGKLVADLTGHVGRVDQVVFAAKANVLVSAGQDKMARLWDVSGAVPPGKAEPVAGERLTALLDTLLKTKKSDVQIIEALTLATLARLPSDAELKLMTKHVAGKQDRREAFADVLWSLVNSLEFHANVEDLRKQDPRQGK